MQILKIPYNLTREGYKDRCTLNGYGHVSHDMITECCKCRKSFGEGQYIMTAYDLGEQYCHSDYCMECAIEVLKSVKDDADRLIKELEDLK